MTSKTKKNIHALVTQLSHPDGVTRERAREKLVHIHTHAVTEALIGELNDPRRVVRWEAAKGLTSIADPVAAPALVLHLDDEDPDIRWLAAEGLASLDEPGLLATLSGAMWLARSTQFCHAAHHVFRAFHHRGVYADILEPVLQACQGPEPGVVLPVESYRALHIIRTGVAPEEVHA